jgi:hypothetical protein
VNDLGFQTAADRILFDTHFQYNQTRPGRWFRSWSAWGGPNGIWNLDGDYLLDNTNLNARWQFANYWGGPTLASARTAGAGTPCEATSVQKGTPEGPGTGSRD